MRLDLLRTVQEPELLEGMLKKPELASADSFIFPAGLAAGAIGLIMSIYTKNPVAGILLGLTIYEIAMSFADLSERKHQDILDDQVEIFLVELGSVASKMPFLPGIKAVTENTPQPLCGIIKDLVRRYEMGIEIELDSKNKDLKMLVELIKLKEVYGGDISGSLIRLAEKARSTRNLRSEIKVSLKGSQVALVSQYGLMGVIMFLTLRQDMFQDIMIGTFGGKIVMAFVALAFYASARYSRRVVKY